MESSENLNNDYSGGGFISKDRKNEDEIIFIFHVHMPENIDKIGQPVVLGDGQELGFWEQPNIKLHQPLPQSPTYWRSDSVKISVSITTEGYDIQYKYAICEKESEKNILEGNSNRENRTLDIMRIDQFGIWKNTYDLPNKFRLFPKYIRDFAFVDYIYNSVNVNNLKDKVLEYQYLLSIYNELTIRVSEPNFIINHIDDKLREKRLFSCLLLGYYVSRQNTIYELPNQFPSDLLLDALEGYKQEVLPSDTKDPMYNAITTLIHHNAFKMQFNWLKVFTIDVVVESNYMFIDRLRTLKYPNNHLLTKFIEEVKVVMPYIDNHKFEKLAKWLIELCQDMDGLLKLWSDVLSCREVNDKNILKCFIDRIQENISVDDAVALANHFKDIPKIFRENVSSVFRDRVFLLLSSPSSKWTNPNIFAIQNLLRNGNLNWRSDDAIISMELISQSNNFELLNIFPEILDDWFRREFSDSKKKIPIICVTWFTNFLTELGTSKKSSSNESSDGNFIFLVFQQLERMFPLLGQRMNLWRDITSIAIKRVKGCSETQIFATTKLILKIQRMEFKKLFLEMIKEILNKSVQQIDDQLIDKLFIICDCNKRNKILNVPNPMSEEILCYIMIRLQSQSFTSSEIPLNVLKASKFWKIVLCATGNVEKLHSNPFVQRIKASINELGGLLLKKTIDIRLLQQLLKYSDDELFSHFDATVGKKRYLSDVIVSRDEIAKLRGFCNSFQLQFDMLFQFYGRFCSAAHDIDDYIQQLQFSDGVNLNQAIAPDFWAFHEKTLDSTRRCYKYHQSQTFLNIFEVCYEEDAATKVEYIAQKLMPIVFERYDALVEQFRDWEKLKSSDTSLYWKNVMNVNEELELMGYQHQTDKFIKTLDHLSKIPHWIERLEQLEKVAYIFNVPRNKEKEDWLLKSIRLLKDEDCGVELVQIINIFEFLDKNLSTVNENCWKLITELSNADNFIDFLKNIADHDITNLINGVDDHSDENLIQEDTVTSLIQVKQFLMCLMKKNMDTVADVLKVLLNVIKTNPTLGDKISLCSNSNMALQNMYNNISNRGEVTKEKIKNAVKNGIYTFKRDEKEGDKCQVILEYTSKTNMQYNLNEIFDLRGGALLIATPKTTVRINDDCVVNDKDEEMSNIIDDFIVQVDTAQEIFNVGSVLIQMGHFGYRIYEQKLHGTESMINYLKSLKNELDEWKEIVDKAHEFCYYLTFFSSRHILAFYDYFTSEKLDKENNEECKILIRFVNSKAQLPPREGVQKIPHESNDYLEILCVIGNELERIFKNVPKQSRKLKALGQHVKSDIVTKGKLFVAACNNASLVSNIIMSLFANHGSYPEPWQLLICTSSTTIEEFTIFIKRSFFASNNGYENHLFCIANLELLDFELQYSLVNQIKSMRDQTGKYLLALICCREAGMHHHILDQFSLDVHVTNGLSTETMIEIYHNLCKNVIAVSSDLSGQGKTEWIKESSYKKKKITHSFLISDGIEYNRLVHQFKKCKLLPIESLHINIVSPDHPEDVNMFLFELLTLGIVSTNDNIACLPSSETPIHIFIEIASTTEQRLRSSLPMVGFLLSEHLSWNISNLKISREIHSPIQIVCHYLNLYESMEIDTKEILFRTDDAIKEPLPLVRCQNLIDKYFFNKNNEGIFSYRFVEVFVNVLADQLVRLSSSPFFTVDNLKLMVKETNIRSLIVDTLIGVSKDFATRSIKTKAAQLESEANTDDDENARLGTIVQWDDSNHLIVVFNSQTPDTISALYRDRTKVPNNVKILLSSQVIGDKKQWQLDDYNKMTENALLVKLQFLARRSTEKKGFPEYAFSGDNLIKMALILLRARANIPVIVCGEAGCGKTSLIAYLANMVEVKFETLNLHAGVKEENIMEFMNNALEKAVNSEIWLFFDEINTCNHIGLLSDLISHRILNGKPIHPNIRLFSACNPYRIRTKAQSEAGLTSKVKKYEEKSNLVYQVKPLPDQILDYVWDYGVLKQDDEFKYIQIMVDKELKKLASPVFANLLFASQKFIREVEEPYSVSLRDVKRAITLVKFFYNSLDNRPILKKGHRYPPKSQSGNIKTRSYVLALSLCYHSRLYDQILRKKYRIEMEKILNLKKDAFSKIIRDEQEDYINRMQCPPNLAKNEALLENVLVMIACILTKIPLFLIGAPGSSKSLAIRLISSNLRGSDSNDKYFKMLPQIYLIPHQGTTSSTSDGLIKVFEKANTYQETSSKLFPIISVILLDHVGLAETSPYNPLKVLHSLLESSPFRLKDSFLEEIYPTGPTVSVIGISNWRLDISKSSRALLVQRPQYGLNDLVDTAESLLSTIVIGPCPRLAESLAKAYSDYGENGQDTANFHGLRDYYSLVKRLSLSEMTPENIQMALARNFGGTANNAKLCNKYFGDVLKTFNNHIPWFYEPIPIERLIDSNLDECDTRHLMVIGKSDSIVDLLTYQLRRRHLDPVVILGSKFPEDQDDYSYNVLNRIMMCAEAGKPLILTDLDIIYGSIYDLWDQNYIIVGGKNNTKYFTRVALGAYANPMLCVSPNFKCILVMDEKKVRVADPPLLNRFEKQKMSINDVVNTRQKSLVVKLGDWARRMSTLVGVNEINKSQNNEFTQKDLFIGFNEDETLQSLVVDSTKNKPEAKDEEILIKCKERLTAIATSDGIVRAEQSMLEQDEIEQCKQIYLQQKHDNLYEYFEALLADQKDSKGHLVIVNTFSNINTDVKSCLPEYLNCQEIKLSTFKNEAHLTNRVKKFWLESTDNMLIFQCNATAANAGCIKLAKFIIEQFQREFLAKKDDLMEMKHACIILHIHRDQESILASFNFMCGWRQMTIETLSNNDVPLHGLLDKTLSEIINSSYPFKKILQEELLWCLLCMKYPSNIKFVNHIKMLSEKILECPVLIECLKARTLEWIERNSAAGWQYKVALNKQLLYPYASFSVALQFHIRTLIRNPIAKTLCALERLSATKTLFYVVDNVEDDVLLEFWKRTCMDNKIVNITDLPDPKPDLYTMPVEHLYDLEFPFSFYFIKEIDNFKRHYEEELAVLEQDEDKIDNTTNELEEYEIEKHLKRFKEIILTSVSQLEDSPLERFPELYFNDFVTVIASSESGNMNTKILALILKRLIGADKVHQPILLHTFWWKKSSEVIAQLQLVQMAPEIVENIEDQENDIIEEKIEIYIVKEITKMMLQNICENLGDEVNTFLINRWQHDVSKILFLCIKITRAKNLPDLQLLRIVNDLVTTKIPLKSIREIVQLGLNSNDQEVLSEEFFCAILDKLDLLEQNEKNLISKRSFIMRCLALIPIESDVRLSLYNKLFSSEPFRLMGAIVERIFLKENDENDNIFFTIITNAEEAIGKSARLVAINECFKDLDTNIVTLCCDVIEQTFFMDYELEELSGYFGDALGVLSSSGAPALQKITAIALLKEFVRQFWNSFLQEDKNRPIAYNKMEDDEEFDSADCINQVNESMNFAHPLIHALKIYFLRDLRQRDFSNDDVRKFCEAQKRIIPWIGTLNWENVKENRLPFNPYFTLPEYDEADKVFTTLYNINHQTPIHIFIQKIKQKDTITARISLMGLFFVRLHAIRASREWQHPEKQSADFLIKELAGMNNLPELYKKIATKLFSNDYPLLQINNSNISNTDLVIKSVIAHIITYHASVGPNSSQLAMYLHQLQDCQNLFILTCSPDIESMVLNAIAGEGVTSYACKCGMKYVINNCGYPMESSICLNCKQKIGGGDHKILEGNTKLGAKVQHIATNDQAGYIGELLDKTMNHFVRSLKATSYRILHLIVHALIGASSPQPALAFLRKNNEVATDAEKYCMEHIQNDWEVLKKLLDCSDENLALMFHSLITLMMEKPPLPNQQIKTAAERENWEMVFQRDYIELQIRDITDTATNYRRKIDAASAKNQNNVNTIESEIDQTLVMDKQYRNTNLPSLWRMIGTINFDSFRAYFISDVERNANNYPFLSVVFKHAKQLEFLKHLLPIVKFVQLLNSKFGYYLTRQNAREMTFRDFIESGGENSEMFNMSFEDFKLGWNTVKHNVTRFQCHELPNIPDMESGLRIVLGLMEAKDEGIFLCAILYFLINLQNTFLREVMAIPPGTCKSLKFLDEPVFDEQTKAELIKPDTPKRYFIQSMRIDRARTGNIIKFTWDDEILAYSQRNFEVAKGRGIVYDLAKIEAELANILVFDKVYIETVKPESQLYLENFPYQMELFQGCMRILSDIKYLIPQEPIPIDKINLLCTSGFSSSMYTNGSELTLENASETLSSLEILLGFVKRTAVGDGERSIKNYIKQWIKLSSLIENAGFSEVLNIDLRLKHLVALYELVEEQVANLKIKYVNEKYKVKISDDMEYAILRAVDFEQTAGKDLIPAEAFALALKRYMLQFLTVENHKETDPLYLYLIDDTLNFWPSTLSEDLIEELFPQDLMVAHTYSAYEFATKRIELRKQELRKQAQRRQSRNQANNDTSKGKLGPKKKTKKVGKGYDAA